jgi:hypothetical protein
MINWKVRYAALLERYPELFFPNRGILEVGSGTEGIARYLKRPVVGIDRVFSGGVGRHLAAVCGAGAAVPQRRLSMTSYVSTRSSTSRTAIAPVQSESSFASLGSA